MYHGIRKKRSGKAGWGAALGWAVLAGGIVGPGIVALPHATPLSIPGVAVWTTLYLWALAAKVSGLGVAITLNVVSWAASTAAIALYETRHRWTWPRLVIPLVAAGACAGLFEWANSHPRPYSEAQRVSGYVVGCGPFRYLHFFRRQGCAVELEDNSMVPVRNVPQGIVSVNIDLHRKPRLLFGHIYEYAAPP